MKAQRRTNHRNSDTTNVPLPSAAACLAPAEAQAQRPAALCVLRWLPANATARRTNPALMARLA
jgi:hypothetical protein